MKRLTNQPPSPTGGEYDVGYGRPPAHARFKPGKSGNPRGRPTGRKNLTTVIRDYAQGLGNRPLPEAVK